MCEPRPIDLRCDRPFRNLTDTHRAGKCGLNATFPVGSLWEVGPFVEGCDPEIVRITGPAYTSGRNYSMQPENIEAKDQPCWFIACEVVWTPHRRPVRKCEGQPPHVLAPLTPRMAAVSGLACCDCSCYVPPCSGRILACNAGVIQAMRAESESLRETIREQQDEIMRLGDRFAAEKARADAATVRLRRVREALS